MAGQDTRFIGEGGLADYSREKARVWIQKAAEGGDESAIAHLKKLNDEDEAEVVRKAAEEEANGKSDPWDRTEDGARAGAGAGAGSRAGCGAGAGAG